VPYALLLSVVGALLNMIPYIGNIVAMGLAMLVALVTGSTTDVIWVVVLFTVVQFLDNNLIVPRIVASRVKLNALVSIVIVIAFGMLWGMPGMFLSIPITGIVKAICDRMERLEPLGYLLGDAVPTDDHRVRPIKRRAQRA
jgi:predicted PurR-regulated permease PerM